MQSTVTSVEVAADVQAVQLSNAEVASTITATQVQNLPVLGRQVSTLFLTQAGVAAGSNTTSVNGLRTSFSNVTLDGINIQDNFIRTNGLDYAPMRTTIDQIAEITVSTSNAGTAIGGGASQMVLSTKSGSNTFHGAVYWYNRNSALAANDWFNNQAGVKNTMLNLNQAGARLSAATSSRTSCSSTSTTEALPQQAAVQPLTHGTDATMRANGILDLPRRRRQRVQESHLASVRNFTADPTIKAMIAALPARQRHRRRRRTQHLGLPFQRALQRVPRSVRFQERLLPELQAQFHRHLQLHQQSDRPSRPGRLLHRSAAGEQHHQGSPAVARLALDGFAHADQRSARRFHALRYRRSWTATIIRSPIVGDLLFSNPVNTFLNQGRKVNTYYDPGQRHLAEGQARNLVRLPGPDAARLALQRRRHRPHVHAGHQPANTTGLTATDLPGIRSADLTTANNLYANLAGIISSGGADLQRDQHDLRLRSRRHQPAPTDPQHVGRLCQDKWKVRAEPHPEPRRALRILDAAGREECAVPGAPPAEQRCQARRCSIRTPFWISSADPPAVRSTTPTRTTSRPNVGFAWDPFKGGKTSIRGGYMIAFVNDNVVTTIRNSVTTTSGLAFGEHAVQPDVRCSAIAPTVAAPAYKVPRTLADNYAITTTSATGMPDPNLRTPYVQQWNFGIQHDFEGHHRFGPLHRQQRHRPAARHRLQPGSVQRQRLPGRFPARAEQRLAGGKSRPRLRRHLQQPTSPAASR